MDTRTRRNKSNLYTEEQVKRVLTGSGISIEADFGGNFIVFCPFHGNHRTPAGEVSKTSGIFFCFSCQHVADLTELIMHTSGRNYFEASRFIKSKEQESNIQSDIAKKLVTVPEYSEFDSELINRLNEQALQSSRATEYFLGRKISMDSIKKFKLGYSEKQDMVTIPVASPNGIYVGFVGRSIEGKDFKNTPGLPKSKILFNLHNVKASSKVYVVESSFDAIRLDQCGLPAVATLGANVSGNQLGMLQKYFNNVIVIADNDEAGGMMSDKIISSLGNRASRLMLDSKYKDIGDMEDSEISKLENSFDKSIAAMLK